MTVALSATDALDVDAPRPAGWWARAGAFGIDVAAAAAGAAAVLLTGWSVPEGGWLRWVCMLVAAVLVVAVAVNRLVLPARTGWSLGRAVFGIAVVDSNGEHPGPGRLALRDLAHLADTVPLLLGWLWPLIDRRGRTFADILVGTEVIGTGMADTGVGRPSPDSSPDWRRRAARVLAGIAAVTVLVAVLGYAGTYRHQRARDQAREQIAMEGPKIVVGMLSYTAKSASEDFATAQQLVTDSYRPELIKQQEAVAKAPVDNDYWVSNSAVLSSSADRATMLMLLQGQRGAVPNQRFVTASVRVEFEKSDTWKLSNLTVLSAPKSAGAPKAPDMAKPTEPTQGGR